MKKNVIVLGTGRVGKTTLAKKLNEELNYSVIGTDDIISAFKRSLPQLGINSSYDSGATVDNLTPFLAHFIGGLAYRSTCHNGTHFVIEGSGSHFDLEKMMPILDMYDEWKDNCLLIGLIYPSVTPKEIFDAIREHDVENDWTYNLNDEELKTHVVGNMEYSRNFREKFQKFGLVIYEVSQNREEAMNEIINDIKNKFSLA